METRVGIIVTSANLDKVLPAFHLATTSASMGIETAMFFASYGINVIHKEKIDRLPISIDGAILIASNNKDLQTENIFELVQKTTEAFKGNLEKNKIPTLSNLVSMAIDLGVKLFPCQNAIKSMGLEKNQLINGIEDPVGAATFIQYINSADKPLIFNF